MMALVGLILVFENMYTETFLIYTFPTVRMKSVWISVDDIKILLWEGLQKNTYLLDIELFIYINETNIDK